MEIFDYDNILLLPRKCRVESRAESRAECDARVQLGQRSFRLPVVPANMKTLTSSSPQRTKIPAARRRCPAARMFLAAFTSLSWTVAQVLQTHSLIRKPALPFGLLAGIVPQHEQVWVE